MNLKIKYELLSALNRIEGITEYDLNYNYTDYELRDTVMNLVEFYRKLYKEFYCKDMPKQISNFKTFSELRFKDDDSKNYIIKKFLKLQKEARKLRSSLRRVRG